MEVAERWRAEQRLSYIDTHTQTHSRTHTHTHVVRAALYELAVNVKIDSNGINVDFKIQRVKRVFITNHIAYEQISYAF